MSQWKALPVATLRLWVQVKKKYAKLTIKLIEHFPPLFFFEVKLIIHSSYGDIVPQKHLREVLPMDLPSLLFTVDLYQVSFYI